MEKLYALIFQLLNQLMELASTNQFIIIILALLGAFGILGQVVLYYKCSLPGVASIVPFWNVVVFLKIMGRPAWQSIFIMVPPPILLYVLWNYHTTGSSTMTLNIAFIASAVVLAVFAVIVYIELCKCFGKANMGSYITVLLFNGFYVMYLGMSGDTEYQGPLYGPKAKKIKT